MCGIVGWLQTDARGGEPTGPTGPTQTRIDHALAALSRRGPDHQQAVEISKLWLGHARLSILDLSTQAHQPMQDETGRYWLAFNGEIFNYQELKKQTPEVHWRTSSDTEVLLQLLIQQGAACLPLLNGFFAFAFYDAYADSLLLARDRYGIKPLVWFQDAAGLRFASEAKALFPLGLQPQLNREELPVYLALNYLPPDRSLLQGLQKLQPGHYLTVAQGEVRIHQWYSLPVAPEQQTMFTGSYAAAQCMLETLLDAAVARRMVADVPLGVFLSGGIDSSVVATLARRHTSQLHTFSISFSDPLYDESRYAEAVARRIGSEHLVFRVTDDDLDAAVEPVLDYLDEPFADASAVNMYLLSACTRRQVTVALSGDGADELLGGYSKHQAEALARSAGLLKQVGGMVSPLLGAVPANRNSPLGRKLWQVRKLLAGWQMAPEERYLQWCSVQPMAEARRLLLQQGFAQEKLLEPYAAGIQRHPTDFNRVLAADMQLVLPGDMLVKVDWMSMARSLEVRVPFLDYTVVDFAFSLPAVFKTDSRRRKKILQDAFRSQLPPELYNRPKQGFEVPLRAWLTGSLQPQVTEFLLNEDRLRTQGLFRPEAIRNLWQAVEQGRNGKEDWTLWALLVFQRWYYRMGMGAES